jgi:hypothetical protein
MEQPLNTTLARGRNDNLGAAAIDGMKVVLTRDPHARQAGKMVNFVDPIECLIDQFAVEYRALDVLCICHGAPRRAYIENARLPAARDERCHQMLADEAAAARDKNAGHRSCCTPPWLW